MKISDCSKRNQLGQTLLAFLLVIVVGSSYLLVRTLNANAPRLAAAEQAAYKLKLAKQALIGYAVTFPDHDNSGEIDGPGYLLCPDTDNDGDAEANCSEAGGTFIGRIPWNTLELPDLYDASGQTLWYALSENYRYGNNKRIPLNSETEGTLTVDGIDDIVAIIFAPGIPVTGQNRTAGSNSVTDFLDGENSDGDTNFVTTLANPNVKQVDGVYDVNGNLVFNDRLLTISRAELMRAVEKRVLGEFNRVLANYFATYNAYPWLTTFADPKAHARQIQGQADSGSTATVLVDSTQDFQQLNVRVADIVYNITDGSLGSVASNPTQPDRITVTALSMGTDNDFDENDEYIVISRDRSEPFTGVASGGSVGQVLEDVSKNFADLAIAPGDIVDNLTDGSSGIIDDIAGDTITVTSLTGGADNTFANLDNYAIRSNYGSHTGASGTLFLQDNNKDFTNMGVVAGDLVWNMTDDSMGRVIALDPDSDPNTNDLAVDQLLFGTENDFDAGDMYMVVRHEATTNVRKGLLSLHEVGVPFQTDFQLEWAINAASADYELSGANSLQQNYLAVLLANENRSFPDSLGTCVWSVPDIADCYGYYRDYLSIDGRMTSGNNTDNIEDSNAALLTDGVKRGDIVQNFDDEATVSSGTADSGTSGTTLYDAGNNFSGLIPYSFIITNNSLGTRGIIAEIIDSNTLVVESYIGSSSTPITFSAGNNYTIYRALNAVVNTVFNNVLLDTDQYTNYNPDFDTNEYYRVIPSSASRNGRVDSVISTGSIDTLRDWSGNFITNGIEVGDLIRNEDGSWGEITALTQTTIQTTLYDGSDNYFSNGDDFTIYYNYVYSREHILRPRYRGNLNTTNAGGVRNRAVCLGYSADCSSVAATNFTGNGSVPLLTVIDYQEDQSTVVGIASFTPTNNSNGSVRVSNIKYNLAESSGDFPAWLTTNDWHKLVFVAYSSVDAPVPAGVCTSGDTTDCLTLTTTWHGNITPQADKRALLYAAGREVNAQDRTVGTINNYYELENNTTADDIFAQDKDAADFNDQVRVMATAP